MTDAQHNPIQSRQVALDLLLSVLDKKQPLDIMLDRNEAYRALDQRDRAFTRMIVSTTLRKLGQIDDLIRRAATQSRPPSPPALYCLLRLSVCQICFMDVPDYAVVDSAVRLAERNNMVRQKGFVNGLLRTIGREWKDWVKKQDAGKINIPAWLLKYWIADYGLRCAAEIALASQSEAATDITLKQTHDPAAPDMQHWADMLDATILPTGSLRLHQPRPIPDLHGFDDGDWWVQDASSALPATLFPGDIHGSTIVDLCAAPGGKTAQLAAQGANVIAVDRSAQRLKRLHENLERLKLGDHVHVETADGSVWKPQQKIDHILVDAPCSATGTIRRHPDVMHLRDISDIERMQKAQQKLLRNAWDMLPVGGVMIYCTCSLQHAEGEHQIAAFLDANTNARRLPVQAAELGDLSEIITPDGDVRVLPQTLTTTGGMDGFYIARLQKS